MALPRVDYWLPEPVTLVTVAVTVTAGDSRCGQFDRCCDQSCPGHTVPPMLQSPGLAQWLVPLQWLWLLPYSYS